MDRQNKIKLDYYDCFSCIADQCSITCCGGWRIAVDNDTFSRWQEIDKKPVATETLCSHVNMAEDAYEIALDISKNCPFLNSDGLCKLILGIGEEVLSKTCTTFPRQVNAFEDREEYSLAACCPAVVDFLKEQDKIQFILESEVYDTTDFLFNVRKMMLAIIQDNTYSVSKSMLMIFDILLGINQKQIESVEDLEAYSDWRKLQSMSDTIDKMQFNISDTFLERNELFLDLVENYRKQGYYTKYLEPIAKKAEKLEDEYDEARILSQIEKFEKVFAPYNKLFRNYVASETFASCLMPGGDLESMIVAFQWIAMEYATMMHSIFLEWAKKEPESLEYSMVRDYIVVIARVTGYDADDVWEYLEESFESIIWDWGYLALVVGEIN